MKSHMLLLRTVLNEMGTRCCTSTTQDWKTIESRVQTEGLSFLTITLPQFCKDLEKGLDKGEVASSLFQGYRKKGRLPLFLGGFVGQLFDRTSGRLVDLPNADVIQAIRQITLLYSKIQLPCSDARVANAFVRYVDCEQDVRATDASLSYDDLSQFKRLATVGLVDLVISKVDRMVFDGITIPKHGPGAVAERLLGNQKYNQNEWTERLEEIFPHVEFLFSSWGQFFDPPTIDILEPGAERPVRVVSVPKTLKTPRVIGIEPTCMQYAQQGMAEILSEVIHSNPLMNSFIGYLDQEPNQLMAKEGSMKGTLATLDLSEASDRVSNQLVRLMTCYHPWFSKALDACRSRKADVPGHGVIRLAKFASMGSALCFPIEAMVFFTIILCGIEDELKRPLTFKDVIDLEGKVRVYGDDIVVPVEYVRSVVNKLETFGLLVNADKSFWTGKFRESCGKEYYDGDDVSVVKCRRNLPTQRRHVQEIISAVSLRNQMYFAGNWETAAFLDELIGKVIPFPVVLPESPALGRHSFLGYESQRLNRHLHRDEVFAAYVRAPIPPSPLDGYGALLKFFLKRGSEPTVDRNHLERAGRPRAVNIKLGWVTST